MANLSITGLPNQLERTVLDCSPFPSAVTGIRLVGGPNRNAGRLEVRVGGWWGTVCSARNSEYELDENAAKVACRQLGKSGGIVHNGAFYGPGSSNMPVVL